jgi:hypothetical protein
MASATAKQFTATVGLGLIQLAVSVWFILCALSLMIAGVGVMAFAGLQSVATCGGIEPRRATVLVGGLMIAQYPLVGALQPDFFVGALSFGLAFSGFVACLTVIIPALRGLAATPPRVR